MVHCKSLTGQDVAAFTHSEMIMGFRRFNPTCPLEEYKDALF